MCCHNGQSLLLEIVCLLLKSIKKIETRNIFKSINCFFFLLNALVGSIL
jgi:hypothetical protein